MKYQPVLPYVDMGFMAMNEYIILPRELEAQPQDHMQLSVIHKTLGEDTIRIFYVLLFGLYSMSYYLAY